MADIKEDAKYRQKCRDLKRRLQQVEDHNEAVAVSIARTKRAIQRIRLERAFLLEKLEERTLLQVDDSDGTPEPEDSNVPQDSWAPPSAPRRRAGGTSRNVNLPKKPQNAYIIFCDQERDRVRVDLETRFPGESFDLTKAMAEAWKELDDASKAKYHVLYENDKERYYREMAAYSAPNMAPSEQRERARAIKALQDLETKRNSASVGPESTLETKQESKDVDMPEYYDDENPSSQPTAGDYSVSRYEDDEDEDDFDEEDGEEELEEDGDGEDE